jgi:hypothetical protein
MGLWRNSSEEDEVLIATNNENENETLSANQAIYSENEPEKKDCDSESESEKEIEILMNKNESKSKSKDQADLEVVDENQEITIIKKNKSKIEYQDSCITYDEPMTLDDFHDIDNYATSSSDSDYDNLSIKNRLKKNSQKVKKYILHFKKILKFY